MNAQDDRQRAAPAIAIVIAGVAAVAVLVAIFVALRASHSGPPPVAAPARAANDQSPVGAALRVPLKAAQDALLSKNYPDAIARLEALNSAGSKSPYDQHVINLLLGTAYAGMKNYAAAATVDETVLGDGFLKPSDFDRLTRTTAFLNYQIQNYDKAIEFGGRALRRGSTDPELRTVVAQSYFLKGDWDDARRLEDSLVNEQLAAGTTPNQASLELWATTCIKLGDTTCQRHAFEKLNAYYPSPQTQKYLQQLGTAH